MVQLLFVCTGNICRSPIAARLSDVYAARSGDPDLRASSAGIRAVVGHPIHPESARALELLGGDASGHSARQLNAQYANDADLILAMTRQHRDTILEIAPTKLNRTFTLHEAARLAKHTHTLRLEDLSDLRSEVLLTELPDVPDPIGRTASVHTEVAQEIAALLIPILDLCRNENEPR